MARSKTPHLMNACATRTCRNVSCRSRFTASPPRTATTSGYTTGSLKSFALWSPTNWVAKPDADLPFVHGRPRNLDHTLEVARVNEHANVGAKDAERAAAEGLMDRLEEQGVVGS